MAELSFRIYVPLESLETSISVRTGPFRTHLPERSKISKLTGSSFDVSTRKLYDAGLGQIVVVTSEDCPQRIDLTLTDLFAD